MLAIIQHPCRRPNNIIIIMFDVRLPSVCDLSLCRATTGAIPIFVRQASKPEVRRWIDQVGEVYSKAVIAATVAALIILPLLGVPLLSTAGQRGAVYRAMGLLTTASPCALVLVPLGNFHMYLTLSVPCKTYKE